MDALGLAMSKVFGSSVFDGSLISILFLVFYFGVPIAILIAVIMLYQRCDTSSIPYRIKKSKLNQSMEECIISMRDDIRELKSSMETNASKAKIETDTADILMSYKSLLDAGIISQDEFSKKKRDIL